MHVSMQVRRSIALFVILAAASACSDATSAPRTVERPAFDIQALQPDASRGVGDRGSPNDENVLTFKIDPNVASTYAFGENWIYFPARSICDPSTSGYGAGLWDAPCAALNQPINVTVKWSSKGGYSYATFSPQLRFVPANAQSPSRWVVLSLHTQKKLHASDLYSILYDAGNKGWVDETPSDATLRAWLDPLHNSVVRRIKHFSGYMLAAAYSDLGGMGDASY